MALTVPEQRQAPRSGTDPRPSRRPAGHAGAHAPPRSDHVLRGDDGDALRQIAGRRLTAGDASGPGQLRQRAEPQDPGIEYGVAAASDDVEKGR